MEFNHQSVLAEEVLSFLDKKKSLKIIDATLGLGGHTLNFLKNRENISFIYCFDRDSDAIEIAKKRLEHFNKKIKYINDNFSNIQEHIETKVDYIFADLGISSYQIENDKRGFSFNSDERLDMRMDKNQDLDAHHIINNFSTNDISEILKNYGEERNHKKIANQIGKNREIAEIFSCKQLSDLINRINYKKGKINSSTKSFMALRIAVNNELESLEKFLNNSTKLLKSSGKLMVISFHSLEDRIVKNFMKYLEKDCICPTSKMICDCEKTSKLKILTKKPIVAKSAEINQNSRSRSAKLRIGEII